MDTISPQAARTPTGTPAGPDRAAGAGIGSREAPIGLRPSLASATPTVFMLGLLTTTL